ncbi:DNA polymerase III subunit beta [Tindallia californiensis]|uniref:Beta sliding clamp n=1 Tax=Tindallia californiensis TaxID=159292 RepID=A0A1H3PU56_9FIRM|nr:DNA polymerase III subunit beta [Tindallia californiensis]SDZ04510.1 DNA polymerase III, beta subunit [Tindallia californiensis]
MRFTIDQKDLMKSLSTVQKGVSSKTTLPVLKGVFVEASENYLKLVTTDLEIGIEHFVSAEVEEDGIFVADAKLLSSYIRKLPSRPVTFTVDEQNQLTISCDHISFTLHLLEKEEFPELPIVMAENSFTIPQELFKSMVHQTVFCASQDETKPSLLGLRVELKDQNLRLIGVDGFRLAYRNSPVESDLEEGFTIPVKAMNELIQITGDTPSPMQIAFTDKQIVFSLDNTKMISRRIEKAFIEYENILPNEHETRMVLRKDALQSAVDRASLLGSEGKSSLMKWNLENGELMMFSHTQTGQMKEKVTVEQEGDNMEIAFNARYLMDALRVIEEEEIAIHIINHRSPALIKPVEGDHYLHLVLPVRMATTEEE